MHRLFTRMGVAVGAPLALVAVLGGGIVMAQQSDETPTPSTTETPAEATPESEATPKDESETADPDTTDEDERTEKDCDHETGSDGSRDTAETSL